jgi:hypothetical protein
VDAGTLTGHGDRKVTVEKCLGARKKREQKVKPVAENSTVALRTKGPVHSVKSSSLSDASPRVTLQGDQPPSPVRPAHVVHTCYGFSQPSTVFFLVTPCPDSHISSPRSAQQFTLFTAFPSPSP